MPFGTSKGGTCEECSTQFTHLKKLSEHIKKDHKLTPIEYCIKHMYAGISPACPVCRTQPRFVSIGDGFKKYCKEHRDIAEREAGKIGGHIKKTWNKGQTKETDERIAKLAETLSGEGNPFFGKKHTDEIQKNIADKHRLPWPTVLSRITTQHPGLEVISTEQDYKTQDSLLKIKCSTCETEDDVSLFNLKRCWSCKECNPNASHQQIEISNYVRSLGFDTHVSTRKVISPLELDVWIPDKQIAIEFHGLYWHSGGREDVFVKNRHREKYELCKKNGIRLIQFFSDEWRDKREICESMIRNALGKNETKINARDCELRIVNNKITQPFVDNNHISGYTRSKHHLALIHPVHGIVGVSTTRNPIQKKWGNVLELSRMCFKRGFSVRGGASRLLTRVKQLALSYGYEGVLSYAELRYGEGNVYEKCGFALKGESTINYWYTDGKDRYDRFRFRAQHGKNEKQVANENGVRPVWGCGNKIYVSDVY